MRLGERAGAPSRGGRSRGARCSQPRASLNAPARPCARVARRYDNHNQTDLHAKLAYFLSHPEEAAAIALQGLVHTLRHHRAVSRLDYVLRSAHAHFATLPAAAAVPAPPAPPEGGFTETGAEIALSLSHEVHAAGWSQAIWRDQTVALCKGGGKGKLCGGDPTKAAAEHFALRR